MGKRDKKNKEKKKKKGFGKVFIVFMLIVIVIFGAYMGYSIYKNGGGLQGVLATVLGQDMDELQDLDTMHVLLLRCQ